MTPKWLSSILGKSTKEVLPEWWRRYEAQCVLGPALKSPMEDMRFIVFDTESSGLDPLQDRILSIGAVAVQHKNIVIEDRFECYLRQTYTAKAEVVSVHGILPIERTDMLDEIQALKQFLAFTGASVLVGHHIDFDLAILNQAMRRSGLPKLKNRTVDTSRLAARLTPPSSGFVRPGEYSLDALCKQYHVPAGDRHTAAGDALMTAQLFLKLKARLALRGNKTLGDLLR